MLVAPPWAGLGPHGPFPRAPLLDPLERRWLHYAFFSRDSARSMIANIAQLGGEGELGFETAILLVHEVERGWSCSQWNASSSEDAPWSSFATTNVSDRLELRAAKPSPRVSLSLRSSSTPCVSQCATFHGDHWMRWQSEPGILAEGSWDTGSGHASTCAAVGYHERVRGRWGWPEMGGWVFGFCNSLSSGDEGAPAWSVVFTLLQPRDTPSSYVGSLMLWRRGRHVRYFPRTGLRVSVAGQLDRDKVTAFPALAPLLGTAATVPIPAALAISGQQGHDRAELRFLAHQAARLVIPSETSLSPFSVHEVIGHIDAEMSINGRRHDFEGPAVVEFAGGASRGAKHVY
jgi:hypothetical protein